MTTHRRSALLGASLLAVFVLSACGPGPGPTPTTPASETATASPSSAPTPDPDLAPSFIVVSATSISVGAVNQLQLIDIPFTTDGDEAAGLLADTIGVEPTVTTIPASGGCQAETTVYDWGGLALDVPGIVTTAPGALFSATITTATTSTGLALEGPYAQQVGALQAHVLDTVTGSVFHDDGFDGFIAMSIGSPSGTPESDEWGVYGGLRDGALAFMVSPVYVIGDC